LKSQTRVKLTRPQLKTHVRGVQNTQVPRSLQALKHQGSSVDPSSDRCHRGSRSVPRMSDARPPPDSRALASTSSTLYSTLYSTHSLDASLDSSTLASAPPPRRSNLYAPLASRMLDATGPRRYRTSTLQKTSTLVNLHYVEIPALQSQHATTEPKRRKRKEQKGHDVGKPVI
jgi:hypothetical protein